MMIHLRRLMTFDPNRRLTEPARKIDLKKPY